MSSVVIVHADGLFCDTTHEVPNLEPDHHALRLFSALYAGLREPVIITCESEAPLTVESWLRMLDVKFVQVSSVFDENPKERMIKTSAVAARRHAKLTLFIGERLYDCNHMADLGVPALRYIRPQSGPLWSPDPSTSWQKAVARHFPAEIDN